LTRRPTDILDELKKRSHKAEPGGTQMNTNVANKLKGDITDAMQKEMGCSIRKDPV